MLGALGMEATPALVDSPLDTVHAFALLGGTAIYLLAHIGLRLRNAGTVNVERLVPAILLFAFVPVATTVDALYAVIAVKTLLWAMIAFETWYVYDERRYRLRHDMEIEIPGSR